MDYANPLKKLRVIASTKGHSLEFPGKVGDKLTWVHVPPAVIAEVAAAGMVAREEAEEQTEDTGPTRPDNELEVAEQIDAVLTAIVARGERNDFTASGVPKVDVVSKELGWKVHAAEVKDLWEINRQAAQTSEK